MNEYSKYASLDDAFDGFHYYLAYLKFGIGRATSDSAHEIRDGLITRDEGIALVQRFDGEFPYRHYEEFLRFCDLTGPECQAIMDKWRPTHLWKQKGPVRWTLRQQIQHEPICQPS